MTFTPRATAGVCPPTDLSIAAQPLASPSCSEVLIGPTKHQKNPQRSMFLLSRLLFSSLLPCSGSDRSLSKTIQFCHMAKSSWHPFSMLIRGQLWIFKMVPGTSERQKGRDESDRIWRVCVQDKVKPREMDIKGTFTPAFLFPIPGLFARKVRFVCGIVNGSVNTESEQRSCPGLLQMD